MCDINAPYFNDVDEARKYLEGQRWPDGPVCPHCGCNENIYPVKANEKAKVRAGLYECGDCKKQFTVTVGTVFEKSKVPLHKWLAATYLMCSSKKGMSAMQIHRSLGVTYKTAWFMCHRIREAMREKNPGILGGMEGSVIEADETYIGRKRPRKGEILPSGYAHKEAVISLVERGGKVRSVHVEKVNAKSIRKVLNEQIHDQTRLMTDAHVLYKIPGKRFISHESVNHSIKEYVRGEAHTNTIENYFSILKRGLNGVYQHCSSDHLKRYVGEFDFRYNHREKLGFDDMQRTNAALKGIEGKRLTYQRPNPE